MLLDKLEIIREELDSEKVFDVIGRVFEGVSIKQYMEMATAEDKTDEIVHDLEDRLTKENVSAILTRERTIYGANGDVAKELPRLRQDIDRETYRHILPGYVRRYVENAAPLLGIELKGDPGGCFSLRSTKPAAIDPLLQTLETYPEEQRQCLSFLRPKNREKGVWIHPGEPIFETFRQLVSERLSRQARQGAVFVDPTSQKPYLFHLALVSVVREADAEFVDLAQGDVLECRLVGVKQFEGAEVLVCPVENLLLLKGGRGIPSSAQRLAVIAKDQLETARAFLVESVARKMALDRCNALLATLAERESFVQRGFDYQEAELARVRMKQSEKARAGNTAALKELARIKAQQKQLSQRRDEALAVLRREPALITPSSVTFIAHALVVPSSDPIDKEQHEANTDEVAMALAWAYEESQGAIVKDVHTPELAQAEGLPDHPGFDLLSIRPAEDKRAVEVKGRAGTGAVEVSSNEWSRACNMRRKYWLYVVYDCATPNPRLVRVQDPFGSLLAKAKGSVLISPNDVIEAAE